METESAYEAERVAMVERQIVARGVRDPRVLEAMRTIPRHLFLPEAQRDAAYRDRAVEIGQGQTISQPYMVALMTELLTLQSTDRVLEIGTGSGYQCAILAALAGTVHTVERIPELAAVAEARLHRLGFGNVRVCVGDGTLGWPEAAPYDAIIVTAGAPHIPEALRAQLADGGRLVCPTGSSTVQELLRLVRRGDAFDTLTSTRCTFVPLIGADGWEDRSTPSPSADG